MQNPISLTFGKIPGSYIDRPLQTEQILEDFQTDDPVNHVYILSGVRGAGKTVAMSYIAKSLQQKNDWIIVRLNPQRNMLDPWAASLVRHNSVSQILK